MIRPLSDGVLVRMDPAPAMTRGGLHIPDESRADAGTWRAQRAAKIGTVLAVGPGRARIRRTAWERDAKKRGPLKTEERERMFDRASVGALVPMLVTVGDRVLFEPSADLRECGDDPLVRMGAQYQIAARACRVCRAWVECECVEAGDVSAHFAAAAAWGAVAVAAGLGGAALEAGKT